MVLGLSRYFPKISWKFYLFSETPACSQNFVTILVPVIPPPFNQRNEGFPLEFLLEGASNRIANTQPKLRTNLQKSRTNRVMNKRAFLICVSFFLQEKGGLATPKRLSRKGSPSCALNNTYIHRFTPIGFGPSAQNRRTT